MQSLNRTFFLGSFLVFSLSMSGCLSIPKNPQEFTKYAADMGYGMKHVRREVIARPLAEVVKPLPAIVRNCLNFESRYPVRLPPNNHLTTGGRNVASTFQQTGPGTYRVASQLRDVGELPLGPWPDDKGQFHFVADFKALSATSTEMSYYWLFDNDLELYLPTLKQAPGSCARK